jgi:hypothetical protein
MGSSPGAQLSPLSPKPRCQNIDHEKAENVEDEKSQKKSSTSSVALQLKFEQ